MYVYIIYIYMYIRIYVHTYIYICIYQGHGPGFRVLTALHAKGDCRGVPQRLRPAVLLLSRQPLTIEDQMPWQVVQVCLVDLIKPRASKRAQVRNML